MIAQPSAASTSAASKPSAAPKPSPSRTFTWRRMVRLSGPAAQSWVDDYEQHLDLIQMSTKALKLCHRRRFEEGFEVLETMREGLEARQGLRESVEAVIERYYYGVLGYYFYCTRQWDEASQAMHRANQAVVRAVEKAPFLLPLADACHEFCLHHARIARNQGRWQDMFDRIADVRAMMRNLAPLCVLDDGTRVDYDTLTEHYHSLGELDPADREEIEPMLTEGGRVALLEQFVRRMFALPGFAIQYP